jgi:hypothetical protein
MDQRPRIKIFNHLALAVVQSHQKMKIGTVGRQLHEIFNSKNFLIIYYYISPLDYLLALNDH